MAIALDVANVGQGTAASGVGGLTSVSLVTGATVAAGARIFLGVCIYTGSQDPVFTSVSPSGGLTWTLEGQVGTGSAGDSTTAMLLYADAPAGLASGTTLTVNFTGGGWDASVVASSFTGMTPGARTAEMSDRTGTTTAWTTGNLTTVAGGIVVAVCANGGAGGANSNTVTAPSVEDQDYSPTRAFVTLCHRIESSAGSYSVAGTLASSPNNKTSVVGASYAYTSAYVAAVLADSPVAYYRMNESSGQPQDSSGNANHTTVTSGSSTYAQTGAITSDPADNAIRFTGTSYFSAPDHATLDLGDVFTLECWAKRTTSGLFEEHIIRKDGAGGYDLAFVDNKLSLNVTLTGVSADSGSVTITDMRWHHLVCTKSGAARNVYIDGVDVTALQASLTVTNTTGVLLIGAKAGGSEGIAGTVDEVAVYGSVLTPERVLAHYQAAIGTTTGLRIASLSAVGW